MASALASLGSSILKNTSSSPSSSSNASNSTEKGNDIQNAKIDPPSYNQSQAYANPKPTNVAPATAPMYDDFMYGSTVATCHLKIRQDFLKKVYAIVSAQLMVTTLMSALFMSVPALTTFVQTRVWLLQILCFVSLGLVFALGAKKNEYPINIQLLAAFTLVESYLVATIVTFYDTTAVLQAFILTCGITWGLTIYAMQTKRDWTFLNSTLIIVLWAFVGVLFLRFLFPTSSVFEMGISFFGAILFSAFIVVDTQMMLHKVSVDEYILCAVNLYLDIINLFLYILRILGDRK